MDFYVGQKVVCINDEWVHPYFKKYYTNLPVKGGQYTIKRIVVHDRYRVDGSVNKEVVSFLFEEIKNPVIVWKHIGEDEGDFPFSHFKPLERKTNIESLEKFLDMPLEALKAGLRELEKVE